MDQGSVNTAASLLTPCRWHKKVRLKGTIFKPLILEQAVIMPLFFPGWGGDDMEVWEHSQSKFREKLEMLLSFFALQLPVSPRPHSIAIQGIVVQNKSIPKLWFGALCFGDVHIWEGPG